MIYRSGTLAHKTGLSTDTLRHYEKMGLLGQVLRSENGYREYPETAPERIEIIQNALTMGFRLKDLAEVFAKADSGDPPCHQVLALATNQLRRVERELERLTKLRDSLKSTLAHWQDLMAKAGLNQKAHLLKNLPNQKVPSGKSHPEKETGFPNRRVYHRIHKEDQR